MEPNRGLDAFLPPAPADRGDATPAIAAAPSRAPRAISRAVKRSLLHPVTGLLTATAVVAATTQVVSDRSGGGSPDPPSPRVAVAAPYPETPAEALDRRPDAGVRERRDGRAAGTRERGRPARSFSFRSAAAAPPAAAAPAVPAPAPSSASAGGKASAPKDEGTSARPERERAEEPEQRPATWILWGLVRPRDGAYSFTTSSQRKMELETEGYTRAFRAAVVWGPGDGAPKKVFLQDDSYAFVYFEARDAPDGAVPLYWTTTRRYGFFYSVDRELVATYGTPRVYGWAFAPM